MYLITIILLIILSASLIFPQDYKKWEQPVQLCLTLPLPFSEEQESFSVASDNEDAIFFSTITGTIKKLDLKTGVEVWKTNLGGRILNKPVNGQDSIYVVVSSNKRTTTEKITKPIVRSVSKSTGLTNWQVELPIQNDLVASKLIYFSKTNEIIVLDNSNTILILDSENGDRVKLVKIPLEKKETNSFESNANVFLERQMYLVIKNSKLYHVSTNTGLILDTFEFGKNVTAVNFINGVLFWGDRNGQITAVDIFKKQVLWKVKTGGGITGLLTTNQGVIVASLDNFVYSFSKNSGKLNWKKRTSGRLTDHLLWLLEHYLVVIPFGAKTAEILNAKTGKIINRISINDSDFFSNAPIFTNNFLIFQTNKSIVAFGDHNCI